MEHYKIIGDTQHCIMVYCFDKQCMSYDVYWPSWGLVGCLVCCFLFVVMIFHATQRHYARKKVERIAQSRLII